METENRQERNESLTFTRFGRVSVPNCDEMTLLLPCPVDLGSWKPFGFAGQPSLTAFHHSTQLADPDNVSRLVHG